MGGQAGNIGIGFSIPINTLRDVLPGLRTGKITRGRIGVSLGEMSPEAAEVLNLKDRRGALVVQVAKGGPADNAGVEPEDVIVEFNGKPVTKSNLPSLVAATAPGSTVPMKVVRKGKETTLNVKVEELDLDAENGSHDRSTAEPDTDTGGGFGITLNNVTPEIERQAELPRGTRGAVVTDVDPDSPSGRPGGLQPGDVILRVNGQAVSTATEASQLLRAVPAGRAVGLRVMRHGQDQVVYIRKQ
jgi:serine protease Do